MQLVIPLQQKMRNMRFCLSRLRERQHWL